MNAQESYKTHLSTILAIADEEVITPSLPAEEAIAEAEKLVLIAQRDKDLLLGAGLNPHLIDTLPDRIGSFAFASSNHMLMADAKSDMHQEWQEAEPKGFELRRELLHTFRFAYRKDEEVKRKLSRITSGRGRKDMIYDLLSLYQLGTEHTEPLAAINFDMALLEQAKEQFDELSNIFAAAQMTPETIDDVRIIKNKSHTWLHEAVSEIKEYGKFLFWKDEDRLNDYVSDFRRNNGKRKN